MQLRLLGVPQIFLEMWQPLRSSNHAALLCYLAYRGIWITREEAALLFYPEVSTSAARTKFRQLLRRAKRLSGGEGLETAGEQLRLTAQTDVGAFREALGRGDWEAASEVYQGTLLDGFDLRDAPGFETWLELERAALHATWHEAALKHAAALAAEEAFAAAANLLGRVLQHDLLAEDVVQKLMRYRYAAGQREGALRVYEAFKLELERELDLEPLEETEQLAALIAGAQPLEPQPLKEAPNKIPLTVQRPPQLIGREDALAQLLQSTRPVALVGGEPGVGKTRLVSDAAPDALYLRCLEGLEEVAYFPLVTHLRDHLDTLPELGAYRNELARLVLEIAPDSTPSSADPGYGKVRMLEAWRRYLSACASEDAAFGVFFDDIQWADAATLELLLYLAEQGTLRVAATYRSTEVGRLERTLNSLVSAKLATSLTLDPLSDEAVTRLVASLSSQREGPPLFSRWLHERTGGNPFFMLETLKALFEAGLVSDTGGWQSQVDDITQDYSELEVPAAVAAVVQRRVRSLSQETQRVLPVAAVVREGFTPALLSELTGLSLLAVLEVLEEAERGGLLERGRFSHDLLRESLYASLGETRRSFVHAQAAELLADEADPAVVGEHWFAAGDIDKALQFWHKAVERSFEKGLLFEVEPLLRRVIDLTPPSRERLDALLNLTELYRLTGQLERAEATLAELLSAASDAAERASALTLQAQLHLNRGDLSGAAAAAAEAYRQATLQKDSTLKRDATFMKAMIAQAQGNFENSVALIEPIVAASRSAAPSVEQTVFLAKLGSDYSCLGRYEEALGCYEEALELSKRLGARRQQVLCVNNLLSVHIYLKRPEEVLPLALEALSWGRFDASYALRYQLAKAYLYLEAYQETLLHARVVVEECRQPRFLCGAWLCLAEAYYPLNEPEEGAAALEKALVLAEQTDVPQTRLWTIITAARYGDPQQLMRARALYRDADIKALPAYLYADLEQVVDRLRP